jgi:hypothetical protein
MQNLGVFLARECFHFEFTCVLLSLNIGKKLIRLDPLVSGPFPIYLPSLVTRLTLPAMEPITER